MTYDSKELEAQMYREAHEKYANEFAKEVRKETIQQVIAGIKKWAENNCCMSEESKTVVDFDDLLDFLNTKSKGI